jgi:hypothetical protein
LSTFAATSASEAGTSDITTHYSHISADSRCCSIHSRRAAAEPEGNPDEIAPYFT